MNQELQFLVMANCEPDLDDFIDGLKLNLKEVANFSPKSFNFAKNWIQVRYNEDYDKELIKTDEDAFLYYKYRIEVSPVEDVTLEEQISLAKKFIEIINELNGKAEICSTFEDKL